MTALELLVPVLLALGGGAGLATLITSRSMARKTTSEAAAVAAKTPAEVDSIVVQGAEAAVLTMRSALESAVARIAQLEAEREADRRRILDLEGRLDDLRTKVEAAERALEAARQASTILRDELAAIRRDSEARP